MVLAVAVLVLELTGAGCRDLKLADGTLSCSPAGRCPSPYRCVDGSCWKSPPNDGGADLAPDQVSGCSPGVACPPASPCYQGEMVCGPGAASSCAATTRPQANGTPCGKAQVCKDGVCGACDRGSSCVPPGNPCRVGSVSCTTGAAVCVESDNQQNGAPCGASMVCQGGTCVACQTGAACTPANSCHGGALVCGTVPQCMDKGSNLPAGSGCGQGMVCSPSGSCLACAAGSACPVDGKPCRTGQTVCNTGTPTCLEVANASDGLSCGTAMVCSGGACVTCRDGLSCTPANNPCHGGTTTCLPSVSCSDTNVSIANGSTCGTGKVCSGGACVGCLAGVTCQAANPCKTGLTSCATGVSVCGESGNQPNGAVCGSKQVCSNGACGPCGTGDACNPTNPCHLGALSCTTGSATCADTGQPAPDGTECGPNLVCRSAMCVSCLGGVTCKATNPCKYGVTSCATGFSACVENGDQPIGILCGTQSCSTGVKIAGTCNASHQCTTTTTTCANGCNFNGPNCSTCLAGQIHCTSDACQSRSLGFEDGTTDGFEMRIGPMAATSVSVSTVRAHSGTRSLALPITVSSDLRTFEIDLYPCSGAGLVANGQSVSAWFYLDPAPGSLPVHPQSFFTVLLYGNTDIGNIPRTSLTGQWFQVSTLLGSGGQSVPVISLEGSFASDGSNSFDWRGTVYIDDVTIQ